MHGFRRFDYRDQTVALPLLKWLIKNGGSTRLTSYGEPWSLVVESSNEWNEVVRTTFVTATLEEAVARAAIAVKEKA
mgnify:FL=1